MIILHRIQKSSAKVPVVRVETAPAEVAKSVEEYVSGEALNDCQAELVGNYLEVTWTRGYWLKIDRPQQTCQILSIRRTVVFGLTEYTVVRFRRHLTPSAVPEILPSPALVTPLDLVAPFAKAKVQQGAVQPKRRGVRHSLSKVCYGLGGLLRHLLAEAGCCRWSPSSAGVSLASKMAAVIEVAGAFQLTEGVKASGWIVHARRRSTYEAFRLRLLQEKWSEKSRPYALVLAVVRNHTEKLLEVAAGDGHVERWNFHGKLARPGPKGTRGPYLALITYAEIQGQVDGSGGRKFGLMDVFLQPIATTEWWIPVDSHLERGVLSTIQECCLKAKTASEIEIIRPVRTVLPGVLPDFILKDMLRILAIEVLGGKEGEYLKKKRTDESLLTSAGYDHRFVHGHLRYSSPLDWRDEQIRFIGEIWTWLGGDRES